MAQKDVLDYIRETPHNSNVNVVKGMLNFEGDSGQSDFSTAQVTIINNITFASGLPQCISQNDMTGISVGQVGEGTFTVPLWKGHLYLILHDTTASVSGSAELIYGGAAIDIFGDCTITAIN